MTIDTLDVTAEVVRRGTTTLAVQTVKKSPKPALHTFKAPAFETYAQFNQHPDMVRKNLPQYHRIEKSEENSWELHCFFEPLKSDHDIFKVYVLVRKPGILDAVIQECVDKIKLEMDRFPIDEPPQTVTFKPLRLYSLLYPTSIANTQLQWIAKAVATQLQSNRISASFDGLDSFSCRKA